MQYKKVEREVKKEIEKNKCFFKKGSNRIEKNSEMFQQSDESKNDLLKRIKN